jgi:hypothetical protein
MDRTQEITREDEGWVIVEAPLAIAPRSVSAWTLLEANHRLPGLAKIILRSDGRPVLRADVPRAFETDPHPMLERARSGFEVARDLLAGDSMNAGDVDHDASTERTTPLQGGDDAGAIGLGELCEEAGWSFNARASGLVVDLEVPGREFYQAFACRVPDRGVHVAVEVARGRHLSRVRRLAAGDLMLAAGRALRLARPAVVTERDVASGGAAEGEVDAVATIVFEAWLEPSTSAFEFDHALSSLSAAARLCGREVKVLVRDEELAGTYLGSRPTRSRQAGARVGPA